LDLRLDRIASALVAARCNCAGMLGQVLYGHLNSCNHAVFNMQGDTIASTDADGIVKLWDVRMVRPIACSPALVIASQAEPISLVQFCCN
jgi:WD40 repeat protein